MNIVYIAGPYVGQYHDHRSYCEIDHNINVAREAAVELTKYGLGFFCPHLHSAHFEVIAPGMPVEYWYELDMRLLEACDAILMVEGWERSRGAKAEKERAEQLGLPVFYSAGEASAHFG